MDADFSHHVGISIAAVDTGLKCFLVNLAEVYTSVRAVRHSRSHQARRTQYPQTATSTQP